MKLRRALAFALAASMIVPFAGRAAAQDAPRAAASKDSAPKKKTAKAKKRAAKKKKAAAESQYKSRVLSEGTINQYRFDANGNPVGASGKKKIADKPACAADASCSDKKSSEADSL